LADNTQINKAQALRKAQLDLLSEEDSQYRHPYYWAPFVLVGNWL
jgi:CHAT domain-containing protein